MRIARLPHSHRLIVPSDWLKLPTSDLLRKMALVVEASAGFPCVSPIVQRLITRIQEQIRRYAEQLGFVEMALPLVTKIDLLHTSGVYERFAKELCILASPRSNFIISATSEELVLDYLRGGGLSSYKQMPLRLFHFQELVRFLNRPEYYYKSRQINAAVFSTFDTDIGAYCTSLTAFKTICDTLWSSWGVPVQIEASDNGLAVEYLFDNNYSDRSKSQSVVKKFDASKAPSQTNREASVPARYSSLSMGYPYSAVSSFAVRFADDKGAQRSPVFGTFAIGLQRCIYALLETLRNQTGINFPSTLRPFDVAILPIQQKEEISKVAELIYERLIGLGVRAAFDDRDMYLSKRMPLFDLLATPIRILIGESEISSGTVECRYFGTSRESNQVSQQEVIAYVLKLLSA
jgi:prolyl-tRNA synthetase